MKPPLGVLDDLCLVLEQQDHGAPDRADVDRFVGRVEHKHPSNLRPAPLVLGGRRGP